MEDLISREAAIEAIEKHKHEVLDGRQWDKGIEYGYDAAHNHICDVISRIPPAERAGKWIKDKARSKGHIVPIFRCSNCNEMEAWGWDEVKVYRYCPNCGARMEGEDDDN